MKLQQLMSFARRAIDDYQMIEDGDRIAVGISGGKDSLTLLYALHGLKRFYPHPFELEAITVDLGHPGFNTAPLKELCDSMDIPYTVVKTDIAQIMEQITGSEDIAVLIEGSHSCMTARGIKNTNAKTYTTTLRGRFEKEPELYQRIK